MVSVRPRVCVRRHLRKAYFSARTARLNENSFNCRGFSCLDAIHCFTLQINQLRDILNVLSYVEQLLSLEIQMAKKLTFIDVMGREGNAFVLLACARRLAIQEGLSVDAILAEMQEGDYAHLLHVFHRRFGDSVYFIQ